MGSYRNLIGDSIKPEAVKQIQARARLLGTGGYQDESTILYKARAHQAFIKLSSFVTITNNDLATALKAGVSVDLAKKWTLFNGVTQGNGISQNINDNVNNVRLYGYGQGGTEELGIRPMPGIISATISPAGMAGSVRRAEIKFRCHNLAQLDIIDVLYLRFGFSMLLEWGHTMYTTNAGNIEIEPATLDVFNTGLNWTKEKVIKDLATKRRATDGNYDGMLGLVTNYEWSMTPDGGYDCTLKLTGIGGVIESLKVNGTESQPSLQPFTYTPGQGPIAPPKSSGVPVPGASSAFISKALGTVNSAQKVSDAYSSTLTTAMSVLKEIVKSTTTMADFRGNLDRVFKPGLNLYSNPSAVEGYDHGFNAAYMAGQAGLLVPKVDFNSVYSFAFWSFQGASADSIAPQTSDMVYIPLSLLLAIINNSCLAYEKTDPTKPKPFVYIDFHPETNQCFRLPDQFSLDPSVCLLDNADPGNKHYRKWLENKGVDVNKMDPPIPSYDSTSLQNALHSRLKNNKINGYQEPVEPRGNMMNILVNVDFVIQTLTQMASGDEKQSVYLSQFLSAIMSRIAKVTGNINNFQVNYDDESNVVRIVDEQLVYRDSPVKYETLPVFGLDSIMKSMSFKTEASSKIGSMLAIEAMAGERTSTTDGRDGSAFSALNSRLEDRLISNRTRAAIDTTTANSDGVTARAGIFNSFKWQLYNESKYNPAEAENNINFYAECMNAMKAEITTVDGIKGNNSTSVTARGVLPLSINLTMSGISTILTREGFLIPADRLPAQYKVGTNKVRVGFVIADLTQTIQGQTWNTTIRGQMINLPGAQVAQKSGAYVITKTTSPVAGGLFGGKVMGAPPGSVSSLGLGLPLEDGFMISSFLGRTTSKTRGVATNPASGKDANHYGYDMVGKSGGQVDPSINVGGRGTTGDLIYSIGPGVVRKAGAANGFGYAIYVDMQLLGRDYTVVYGHVPPGGFFVKTGDTVVKGTQLAYIGNEGTSTGQHLHFEIWEGKRFIDKKARLLDPGDMIPLFVADGGKAPGTVLNARVKVG